MSPEHKTPLTDAIKAREGLTKARRVVTPDALPLLAGYSDLVKALEYLSVIAPAYPVIRVYPGAGRYLIECDWRDYSGFTPAVNYASRLSTVTGLDIEAETDYLIALPISKES